MTKGGGGIDGMQKTKDGRRTMANNREEMGSQSFDYES